MATLITASAIQALGRKIGQMLANRQNPIEGGVFTSNSSGNGPVILTNGIYGTSETTTVGHELDDDTYNRTIGVIGTMNTNITAPVPEEVTPGVTVLSEAQFDAANTWTNNYYNTDATVSMYSGSGSTWLERRINATGCNGFCTGLCAGTCYSGCAGCTNQCSGCYSGCAGCDGCSGSCGSAYCDGCSNNCGASCGGNCGSQCTSGCYNMCEQTCEPSCQGACASSCDNCVGGCSGNCYGCSGCGHSNCGSSCSGCWGCTTTCYDGCQNSCGTGGCYGVCSGCYGSCSSCSNSCSSGCTNTSRTL